jgi:NAD(P)-dependent dehydrogenase (short-subunit alcohol dehydrogenase family)
VTGGASGLGKATVERFVKQGAKVIIGDLPTSKGNELASELGSSTIFTPINVCLSLNAFNKITNNDNSNVNSNENLENLSTAR